MECHVKLEDGEADAEYDMLDTEVGAKGEGSVVMTSGTGIAGASEAEVTIDGRVYPRWLKGQGSPAKTARRMYDDDNRKHTSSLGKVAQVALQMAMCAW